MREARATFAFGVLLLCVAGCASEQRDAATAGQAGGSLAGQGGNGGNAGAGGTAGTAGGSSDAGNSSDAAVGGDASDASSIADADTTDAQDLDAGQWQLVWSDEFDGPAGTRPDATHWVFETGGHGFGNNELQFHTDRAENASLDGNGSLIITAREEAYMGKDYTSARLKTQGTFEHTYGRYEARLRIPRGQGIWPAFWMLGTNIGSAGWPGCGEIDIMENVGKEPTTVHGTLHGPGYSGGNGIGASHQLPSGAPFADDYHVFAIEWLPEEVRWYVDGELYQTRTPDDLPGAWVYDHEFFMILNVAVGGLWPGVPDGTTTFPQTMSIDYVRVYDAR